MRDDKTQLHYGGTVVTKDVLPNTIVASNPGKVVGMFGEYAKRILIEAEKYTWDEKTDGQELVERRIQYF
jgi:hypothetical protein